MKRILKIVGCVLLLGHSVCAQQCTNEDALAIRTKWKFYPDANALERSGMTKTLRTNIFRNTDTYRTLFLEAYPDPYGGIITGFGYVAAPSAYEFPGTVGYSYKVAYFGYHCNRNRTAVVTDKVYLSDSRAELRANDLHGIVQPVPDSFELNGAPIQVFKLAHRKQDPRGFLLFDAFGGENSEAMLFTHRNQLPYRVLTRKEYLTMVQTFWEKMDKKGRTATDESERRILDLMVHTKKEQTGEIRETMLKDLQVQLEQYRKQKPIEQARINAANKQQLDAIAQAFQSFSEEELVEPAITVATSVYQGFATEKEGGNYLVVLDPAYHNPKLPVHAAQFLVLQSDYLRNDPGALPWATDIRNKFPFGKLVLLVDK